MWFIIKQRFLRGEITHTKSKKETVVKQIKINRSNNYINLNRIKRDNRLFVIV